MKWFQTIDLLDDGWYWRKCSRDDPYADCIEVANGMMVDVRPSDSGASLEAFEHSHFKGWWWYGPIEPPEQED